MWESIRDFFSNAWSLIEKLWEKHDDHLAEMVKAVAPMVIDLALRPNLSGEKKRQIIVDAILDNAEQSADQISDAMLNEAIEIAANRYNIQIGKVTQEQIDNAREAALKASRDYANKKLKVEGKEAEEANVDLSKSKE